MRRVRYAKAAALLAIPVVLALAVFAGLRLSRQETRTVFFVMDTRVTLTAYGPRAKAALAAAEARLRALDRLWSVTNTESDTYAVNHGGGEPVAVSGETAALLSLALDMARKTEGAFDPTLYPALTAWGFTTGDYKIPSDGELALRMQSVGYEKVALDGGLVTLPAGTQLDFGAIGKGYAAELTAALLHARGVRAALIDIGGNILTLGTKPDGSKWRVAIRDPAGNGNLGRVETGALSVVTSGGYERYFTDPDGRIYRHILDPESGKPAQSGLRSATVLGPESGVCDALSTAIFVMGLRGAEAFWREHRDFEMLLVTDGGDIYLTEGLEQAFSLHADHRDATVRVIRP